MNIPTCISCKKCQPIKINKKYSTVDISWVDEENVKNTWGFVFKCSLNGKVIFNYSNKEEINQEFEIPKECTSKLEHMVLSNHVEKAQLLEIIFEHHNSIDPTHHLMKDILILQNQQINELREEIKNLKTN